MPRNISIRNTSIAPKRGNDQTWTVGDVVTVTVDFSDYVTVSATGTLQLGMKIGESNVFADLQGRSGTSLTFVYTIKPGQNDIDGISVNANPLRFQGGSLLLDQASQYVGVQSYAGKGLGDIAKVNTPPSIVSTELVGSFDESQLYRKAGDVLTAKVKFSEAVQISQLNNLTLDLRMGDDRGNQSADVRVLRNASLVDRNELVFTYTVQAGDTDFDGARIVNNSLRLNGSTIAASADNTQAVLSFNYGGTGGWVVDTTGPRVTAVGFVGDHGLEDGRADLYLNPGDIVTARVDFSEQVIFSAKVNSTQVPSLALQVGNATVQAVYKAGAGTTSLDFVYTVGANLSDSNGISINANSLSALTGQFAFTDRAGNAADLSHPAVGDDPSFRVSESAAPVAPTLTLGTGYPGIGGLINAGTGSLQDLVRISGTAGDTYRIEFTNQQTGREVEVRGTFSGTGYASIGLSNSELLTLGDGVIGVSAISNGRFGSKVVHLGAPVSNGILPGTLNLGDYRLSDGRTMKMNLVAKSFSADGSRVYYMHDPNGDGVVDARDLMYTQDDYDKLLNNGQDVHATQARGVVAGIDDARTVRIGGYTLALPTRAEWDALDTNRVASAGKLDDFVSDLSMKGYTTMFNGADLREGGGYHYALWYKIRADGNGYTWSQPGFSGDQGNRLTVFEVLSEGAFRLDVERDTTSPVSGDATISLGSQGMLVRPVQVEGKTYYLWDKNADGRLDTQDTFGHDELDAMFRYASDFRTVNPGADTTDVYRFATIADSRLALPTYGGALDANGRGGSVSATQTGTAVNNPNQSNAQYDDLLAIWDAFNGSGGTAGGTGIPMEWQAAGVQSLWSATATHSAAAHSVVDLQAGQVYPLPDNYWTGFLVAVQVL